MPLPTLQPCKATGPWCAPVPDPPARCSDHHPALGRAPSSRSRSVVGLLSVDASTARLQREDPLQIQPLHSRVAPAAWRGAKPLSCPQVASVRSRQKSLLRLVNGQKLRQGTSDVSAFSDRRGPMRRWVRCGHPYCGSLASGFSATLPSTKRCETSDCFLRSSLSRGPAGSGDLAIAGPFGSSSGGHRHHPASPLAGNHAGLRQGGYPSFAANCTTLAGGVAMLTGAVETYLAVRRAAGFALRCEGSLLKRFAAFSEARKQHYVSTEI